MNSIWKMRKQSSDNQLPSKRSEAKEAGLGRYFTGNPCKHGHISERQVSDGACIVCRDIKAKAWAEKNRDKRISSAKAWRDRNKVEIQKKSAQQYAENPKKYRAQALASYHRHRNKRMGSAKTWKEQNKDACLAYSAQYAATHKVERATQQRNRYAKQKALGTHTAHDVLHLLHMQRYKCAACHVCVKSKYHVDHVVPLFLNGSNGKENLQILCPTCNVRKNKKDPIEWAQQNGRLL